MEIGPFAGLRNHWLAADGLAEQLGLGEDVRQSLKESFERWDGKGYPTGLSGAQIPLTARLFAIADVWDALTSARRQRLAHLATAAGSRCAAATSVSAQGAAAVGRAMSATRPTTRQLQCAPRAPRVAAPAPHPPS